MGYPRLLKPKWLVFIPLLAILAVVAVACGGDEDTPTAAAPTSTSAAPEPTAMMEATMAPEPTAMMEATMAPEPTAMMEATEAPEPTAMMEATTAPGPTAMMMATPIAIATPTTIPEVAGIQPKYGGIMPAEAAAGSPSTWDPHTAVYLEDIQVQSGMYNQLLEFNPLNDDPYTEGDILGEIARAWEVADDGLSYTFYLREDVTWSDGERLDADDVVWSLNRMIEPGAVRPQTGKLRQYIQLGSVEKVDDFTVTLKITYPSAAFIPFVAVDYMKILPTHILEGREDDIDLRQFESHTVGSGPYLAMDNQHGVSSKFRKNENYWKTGQDGQELPFMDGYDVFYITDPGTAIAAYRTERILTSMDSINHLSVDDHINLENDEEFMSRHDIFWMPGAAGLTWHMNVEVSPFDNPDVRQALQLVVDRHNIVDGLGQGKYNMGAAFAPNNPFALPIEEVLAYPGFRELNDQKHPDDIETARVLMEKHGYTEDNPVEVEFLVLQILSFVDSAQLLKEQAKPIGFNFTIRASDYAAGVHDMQQGTFQIVTAGRANMIPDPDADFPSFYTDTTKNWSRHVDPEITRIWNLQTREADFDKRRELNHQIQRRIYDCTTQGVGGMPDIDRSCVPGNIEYMWTAFAQVVNKKIKTLAGPFIPHFSLYTSMKHEHEYLDDKY